MSWRSGGISRAICLPAAPVALLLVLAGCSSSPTSPHAATGVVTGTAQACAGPAYVPTANLRVYRGDAATARNDVYRRANAVARKQVPTNMTYRFVLPPGRYFITNSSTQFARPFVLSAGTTVHLDVPNWCE
jgi:hypothetical protein